MSKQLQNCPFCGGPAQTRAEADGREVLAGFDGDSAGVYVDAFAWCHECGAKGPEVDAVIHDDDDLRHTCQQAADRWNSREKPAERQEG